ncbi:hypothetical protein [Moorena bouillonii]|nr:hypothetical protein [Moorena bouillonii]
MFSVFSRAISSQQSAVRGQRSAKGHATGMAHATQTAFRNSD